VPDFVSKFIENTKDNESAISFWKWAAYSAISSVLRDNCFRRKKNGVIYPNIYTLFVAPSSGHRKNGPIDLAEALVRKVGNTKTISGRGSIQAIMDEIARGETTRNGSLAQKPGAAGFFATELSAGIVSDPVAIQVLTDVYDYKSNPYKSMLRTGPNYTINKIVFSMLAATNMEISKDFLTTVAVRGGLIARTFIIAPNEFRKAFSELDDEPSKDGNNLDIYETCLPFLKEIANMKGEFQANDCAKDEYRKWYTGWRNSYPNRQDPTGIIGRIHTSIIKLSMILTSNDLKLDICKRHIEEAISEGLNLMPNYNVFNMTTGRSTISEAGAVVIQELSKQPLYQQSRKLLLMNNWNNFDGELLDKVVSTLEQAGLIRQIINNNAVIYQLTENCLDQLEMEH